MKPPRPPKPPGACLVPEVTRDEDERPVWKVRWPQFLGLDAEDGVLIDKIRRAKQRDHEEFRALQKFCSSSGDRDGARFFREEAADALKEYRAACLVLPYTMAEPPGDCPVVPEWDWPVELAPWIDRIVWAVTTR